MGKAFRETFPTLKLDEELEGLLDTAEVTKISTNREHTRVRVYLKAQRLIFKKNIWKLEEMIASQIFQNQEIRSANMQPFYEKANRHSHLWMYILTVYWMN